MNDVMWAAAIGPAGAIIGGWIAGRMTVSAAKKGALQANELNRQENERAKLANAIAFVQAIQAEAEALWILVNVQIAPAIRAIDVNKPISARFVISDVGYFTVYEANASLLGLVDDRTTRKNIVKAYIAARSFIDTIKLSNQFVEQAEKAAQYANFTPGVPGLQLQARVARTEIEVFSTGVVSAWQELESKIVALFESTNEWLNGHGAQPNPLPQFVKPAGITPGGG